MQTDTGSPPYTWGALRRANSSNRSPRITPIYMGSTCSHDGYRQSLRDHPHIHGEHQLNVWVTLDRLGSPPYTWGARNRDGHSKSVYRITPIYMGSTIGIRAVESLDRDHPHIHGEHLSREAQKTVFKGSPPYTWGAPAVAVATLPIIRITPIYMGSTTS